MLFEKKNYTQTDVQWVKFGGIPQALSERNQHGKGKMEDERVHVQEDLGRRSRRGE